MFPFSPQPDAQGTCPDPENIFQQEKMKVKQKISELVSIVKDTVKEIKALTAKKSEKKEIIAEVRGHTQGGFLPTWVFQHCPGGQCTQEGEGSKGLHCVLVVLWFVCTFFCFPVFLFWLVICLWCVSGIHFAFLNRNILGIILVYLFLYL